MRRQIELCLTSDLLEEAKILWVYMLACKAVGAGTQTLSKQLGYDVSVPMAILEERGMVEKAELHNGGKVWRVVKFAISKGSQTAAPITVNEAVKKFIIVYQRLRKAAMGKELELNPNRMKHMKRIVEWLSSNSIPTVAFMKFAIEKGEWLRDQGMPFPTPSWLAGRWIREQWDDAKSSNMTASSRLAPKHAGIEYAEASEDIISILSKNGLDMSAIDDSKLRYIESSAETCLELGEIVGVDPSMIEYVRAIYEHKSGVSR